MRRAQIVRPDGTPIPRLYSAGELGSIYSYLYQGTGNIGECLAFGRVSGRNAARGNALGIAAHSGKSGYGGQ